MTALLCGFKGDKVFCRSNQADRSQYFLAYRHPQLRAECHGCIGWRQGGGWGLSVDVDIGDCSPYHLRFVAESANHLKNTTRFEPADWATSPLPHVDSLQGQEHIALICTDLQQLAGC